MSKLLHHNIKINIKHFVQYLGKIARQLSSIKNRFEFDQGHGL